MQVSGYQKLGRQSTELGILFQEMEIVLNKKNNRTSLLRICFHMRFKMSPP